MKIAVAASVLFAGAAAYPPRPGSLQASSGQYDLGGFKCGRQEPTCKIWYPTDLSKGPFPIATYGHGMGGELIEDLIKDVVSLGMVVVAPATSAGRCDDHHYQDMLHALDGSKQKKSLHKALGQVDWTRTAIMGHSMGGFASLLAGAEAMKDPSRYNVKAIVASHGYLGDATAEAKKITVPSMFTTGTEDRRGTVRGQYEACSGSPKVLAEVQGAEHMEPMINGRLNPFDAHFLGCHVVGLQTSCNKITGKAGNDMCQANKMAICEMKGQGPVPPPHPTPPPSPHPPSPSPSPSPSPDVPQKCQQCFEKACGSKRSDPQTCHQCMGQNAHACAQDCVPTPLKKVAQWLCNSQEEEEDIIV